jgi:hypothetical protein
MNFESLEQEFAYYANQLVVKMILFGPTDPKSEIMSDQITTLVEGVGLGLIFKGEVYNFVKIVFGESAEGIKQILGNEVRCFNVKRSADALKYAQEAVEKSGLPAKQVPLKQLVSIIEEVSMEGDENLRRIWERLLAATICHGGVHKDCISIVRDQVDALDVKIMETIYREQLKVRQTEEWKKMIREAEEKNGPRDFEQFEPAVQSAAFFEMLTAELPVSKKEIDKAATALIDSNLVEVNVVGWSGFRGDEQVFLSSRGMRLMKTLYPEL